RQAGISKQRYDRGAGPWPYRPLPFLRRPVFQLRYSGRSSCPEWWEFPSCRMEFIPEPKRKQTTQAPKQILWPRKENPTPPLSVDFPRLQTTSAPSDLRRIAMVSYSEYPQDPPHRTQEELVWLK